jgi:hypothetical protein
MSPWLRVRWSALFVGLVVAAPAYAQFYDAARQAVGFAPDPLARSARLIGMGSLTVVGDDPHNKIALWDFAGSALGIAGDDSVSTLELRPGSSTASGVEDLLNPGDPPQRQTLAAREFRIGYEGWRRTQEGTAYGGFGDASTLRWSQPFGQNEERRTDYSEPNGMAAITGRIPYFLRSPHWHYALRAFVGNENTNSDYFTFVRNAAGEYLDREGDLLPQANFFVPSDYHVTTMGGGGAISYRLGPQLVAAVGGDVLNSDITGTNSGPRYDARIHEKRPLGVGQATVIGKVGKHFEWGIDGREWTSNAEEGWVFSVSGGIGGIPLEGRGKLLTRDEYGTALHARARWFQGPLELGGGVQTRYVKTTITPPSANDPTSLNLFLDQVTRRQGADTLSLPDSIIANQAEERSWEVVGGAALHLLRGRATIGSEYHVARDVLDQTTAGHGPERWVWNVRTGAEYLVTPRLSTRAGFIAQKDDRDRLIVGNKYASTMMTLGLGLHPEHASWSLETGYVVEWFRIDDADPSQPRGSRQHFLSQIHWAL